MMDEEDKKKIEELKLGIAIEREKIESDLKKLSDLEKAYQKELAGYNQNDPNHPIDGDVAAGVETYLSRAKRPKLKERMESQAQRILELGVRKEVGWHASNRSNPLCKEETPRLVFRARPSQNLQEEPPNQNPTDQPLQNLRNQAHPKTRNLRQANRQHPNLQLLRVMLSLQQTSQRTKMVLCRSLEYS